RRLPRSRRPHDCRRLRGGDVDRDTTQRIDRGIALSVPSRHLAGDDDRPVLGFAHPSQLLSFNGELTRLDDPIGAEVRLAAPRPYPPSGLLADLRSVRHCWTMEKVIEIRRELERGRTATEELLRPASDDELVAQLSPHTPPLVWMLAHVARFEELW